MSLIVNSTRTWLLLTILSGLTTRSGRVVGGLLPSTRKVSRRGFVPPGRIGCVPAISAKSSTRTMMTGSDVPSLDDFIRHRKNNPTNHFVLGNEAGDADSIISAVTLAYIESIAKTKDPTTQKTAIVPIPKIDLKTQRPETMLLLRLAGLSRDAVDNLIYVDDPVVDAMRKASNAAHVTLVDHNRLNEEQFGTAWEVRAIFDHHNDLGFHQDALIRHIAYDNDQALVASTCTLVGERLQELLEPPFPASVSLLLLGTILLDSVNMSPEAGKGTPRDSQVIQALMDRTNWEQVAEPTRTSLKMNEPASNNKPDCQAFFDALHAAKFDPTFWKDLSVRDALHLDYKSFSYSSGQFGISTVLEPIDIFLEKPDPILSIDRYMKEMNIDFFAIMWTFVDEHDRLYRQLGLCCRSGVLMSEMLQFLSRGKCDQASLLLTERKVSISQQNVAVDLHIAFLDQGNASASRKQVAPILQQFFETKM